MSKTSLTNANAESFLEALEALSREHHVAVGGCGCCGSAWLEAIEPKELGDDFGYTMTDKFDTVEWKKKQDD